MKFLIVATLHHPEGMVRPNKTVTANNADLFPPSQAPFFWARSLRKLGHEVDAFIRNAPAVFAWRARRLEKFTGKRGLSTIATELSHRFPRAQFDYRLRNQRLSQMVARFKPDAIMLTGDNWIIFPETLADIKAKHGCKLVYLSGVSPIVFSGAMERAAAPLYDLVLVNDFYHGIQWLELGARGMEVLPLAACDPEFHRHYELSLDEQREFGCDVGFVGTLLPPLLYSRRVKALEAVSDFDLRLWSVHGVPTSLARFYRGPALGERMLRILGGSKIQINPHGNFMRYGGNMRIFEAAACGVFQLVDDLPGIPTWFSVGEQIITYRDVGDLRRKTRYYLDHEYERQQIAQAAQAHAYAHHTYDHRMAALVDRVTGLTT
ncbi:MAG: glycosyltransferase family protein [Aggregatilineales bacterium]